MSAEVDRLGLEWQTVFGLPPVDYVSLASDLGCRYVAITLSPGPDNPYGFAPWSLRDDGDLRRRMVATMDDRGVSISLAEGFTVRPGTDIVRTEPDLDILVELGATRINTVSMDPDPERTLDQFGRLVELAAQRGMETTVEFAPSLTISDLGAALAAVRSLDRPDFRLLIDTMHLIRSGGTASDIAAIAPGLIADVQLSDHAIAECHATYREDTTERMVPGQGELPLLEILAVLPSDVVIGLEVPMRSRADRGESAEILARHCVQGAHELFGESGRRGFGPRGYETS